MDADWKGCEGFPQCIDSVRADLSATKVGWLHAACDISAIASTRQACFFLQSPEAKAFETPSVCS